MSVTPDSDDAAPRNNPYLPIAVGFFLLALPLAASALFVDGTSGRIANGLAALVFVFLGAVLWTRGAD